MEEHERKRVRVNYAAHALVRSEKKGTIGGTVRDISIDTLYLNILSTFEMDEQVRVEIILLGVDSRLTINVPAKVVRTDLYGVAFRFNNPLEWWPLFTFFPFHKLDDTSIPLKD